LGSAVSRSPILYLSAQIGRDEANSSKRYIHAAFSFCILLKNQVFALGGMNDPAIGYRWRSLSLRLSRWEDDANF
jgi:hypothetical protein